jgi:hypothetical protein
LPVETGISAINGILVIMKVYIHVDKLNRICGIYPRGKSNTPEEYKPTLNMFQGRQFTQKSKKELLDYLDLSLDFQSGNVNAQKELDRINYEWNHHKEEEEC